MRKREKEREHVYISECIMYCMNGRGVHTPMYLKPFDCYIEISYQDTSETKTCILHLSPPPPMKSNIQDTSD